MIMPFPAIPALLGVSTVVGGHITRQAVLSGARSGLSQFGQSLPFGAGYSLGTYLGFPKNYQQRNTYKHQSFTLYGNKMAYGYSRRKTFSYRWSRWFNKRVYSRKYRRNIYVHSRY